jgi:hypothetical protein
MAATAAIELFSEYEGVKRIDLKDTSAKFLESVLLGTREILRPIGMDEEFLLQSVLPVLAEDIQRSLCELPWDTRTIYVDVKSQNDNNMRDFTMYTTQIMSLDHEACAKVANLLKITIPKTLLITDCGSITQNLLSGK